MSDALSIGFIHLSATIIIPVGWTADADGNVYPPGGVVPDVLGPPQKVPPDQRTALQPPYVFYPPGVGVSQLNTDPERIVELKRVLSVMQVLNGLPVKT